MICHYNLALTYLNVLTSLTFSYAEKLNVELFKDNFSFLVIETSLCRKSRPVVVGDREQFMYVRETSLCR